MRGIVVIAVAVLFAALASVPASARAPTPIPERYCHSVKAQGETWGVDGTGPPCSFMRHWTLRWLNDRDQPRGWKCVDLEESGDCDYKHSKAWFEYYIFD
jgi:hypothetical protein